MQVNLIIIQKMDEYPKELCFNNYYTKFIAVLKFAFQIDNKLFIRRTLGITKYLFHCKKP